MKKLVFLILIGAVAYWLWSHRGGADKPAGTAGRPGTGAQGAGPGASACLTAAELARSEIDQAARLLLRPPVDQGAWSAAESKASSAISEAESSCGSGGTEGEEKVKAEARGAISSMRSFLSELAASSRGQGDGSSLPTRQQEIDTKLEKARSLLHG